ncbi:ABC transporter permease [Actinokineospora sp. NBRC 105648]|uniref:ABC transporter permease n=1 Tax=Actinokineospora sp. NBRC 105648 TaxID=3032206 RepID=UPI0024A3489A|nr:ABC transporter permease [Actinokineospora sp. NBRC 105648]GLZ39675.1 transport permease protein [Actinokineospora sp. NBRC 105648]
MAITAHVPSPPRAAWLVVEGLWTWYRRNWRSSVVSSVLQPVLYLVALGFGFGSQVRAGAATEGLPYVQYLAPALLVASATQTAAFESTYPVLSAFKWQRTYLGVTATPITSGQLVAGQLTWIVLRLGFSAVAFLLVAALLGALTGPGVLLSLVFALLTAMAFAAPVVAYAATIDSEGQQFNVVFRFIVMPMTMFAGTFFPVEQLPAWVRPLVWLTPLWHGTELSRAAAFGSMELLPTLGHLAYLVALLGVGAHLARRTFLRRLAV